MVFGEDVLANGDDLLEQRHGLFDPAVGFVGSCEHMLRREPGRVVFSEMTIPPLASLLQTPNSFPDPSIHSQTLSNPEQQIRSLLYIKLFAML